MTGSEVKLIAYMEGSRKRFVIPVYQRNYDWKIENCKQLFDDLIRVMRNNRKSHFFGSLVSVYNPDGHHNEFLIIDGQQRLTTMSLLFLAMRNLIDQGIVTPIDINLSRRIHEEYLVDKFEEQHTRIKLKPVKNDQNAFQKLFDDTAEHIKESNLTINYNYFYDRIRKCELTIDELYEAITRLELIEIKLNHDDNPQLIFESLNSTGLALSEGDKIRNFILMSLHSKQQNLFYEKYWNKIEICTNYDVSLFIRDYLSVKQQSVPSLSKIYATFKEYVTEERLETETLLADLYAYAQNYEILIKNTTSNKALRACIDRLNRLETTITRPFFLEVLRFYKEGKITLSEVTDIFLTVENYLFRRTICELPTNMLNKIFVALHREIIRLDKSEGNYVSKFKYALLSKREKAAFPDDKDFIEAFSTRQVYLMNSKNKIYILERFENHGTREDKDIYSHIEEGEYSIEHIMPQRLTPQWVEVLGESYEDIHESWLHRLANLTLTAYNSRYSNSTFQEKKTINNGFEDSGIRMNQMIAQFDEWTLSSLILRNEKLMSLALNIWPLPLTSFKPQKKQLEFYTLEDDVNLSGTEISHFRYKNLDQPVVSWVDMYERVVKILHAFDPSILYKIASKRLDTMDLFSYFSTEPKRLREPLKIEDGLFLDKNNPTMLKLSILRRLFKLYEQEPTDLTFFLKDKSIVRDVSMFSEQEKYRHRFWAFVLPYIQAAHGPGNSYSNIHPTKDFFLNGFVGIQGFNLCSTASEDTARAELVLSKADSNLNKAIFDYLFSRKDEIQSHIDKKIHWARNDTLKSSKIFCRLDKGFKHENNWEELALFYSRYTKLFYDIIVPMILERLSSIHD